MSSQHHELPFASQHLHYDFETNPIESIVAYFRALATDEDLYGHWKTLLRSVKRSTQYHDPKFQSYFHAAIKNIEHTLQYIGDIQPGSKETLYRDFIQLMAHCRIVMLYYMPYVPLFHDFQGL